MHSAYSGCNGVVKLLLDRGANINSKDEDGNTALHLCGYKKRNSAAPLLVQCSACTIVKNNRGKTPIGVAAQEGNTATADAIFQAVQVRASMR